MSKQTNIVVDRRSHDKLGMALRRIPSDFQKDDAMMMVFRKAAKPLLAETSKNMASRAPELYMSASNLISARKSRNGEVMRVGVVNKPKTKGKIAHLFDAGTQERTNYSSGRKTGKMTANYFFRDAVISSESKVLDVIKVEGAKTIDRYIKKNLT